MTKKPPTTTTTLAEIMDSPVFAESVVLPYVCDFVKIRKRTWWRRMLWKPWRKWH